MNYMDKRGWESKQLIRQPYNQYTVMYLQIDTAAKERTQVPTQAEHNATKKQNWHKQQQREKMYE